MNPTQLTRIAMELIFNENTPFYTQGYEDEEEYASRLSEIPDFESVITCDIDLNHIEDKTDIGRVWCGVLSEDYEPYSIGLPPNEEDALDLFYELNDTYNIESYLLSLSTQMSIEDILA